MDVNKQRFEQEYFRIGCYGMGFHDFVQVKQKKSIFYLNLIYFLESCFCLSIRIWTKIK